MVDDKIEFLFELQVDFPCMIKLYFFQPVNVLSLNEIPVMVEIPFRDESTVSFFVLCWE